MNRTFYIASSWENKDKISNLGCCLGHYGLRWSSDWNWTEFDKSDQVSRASRAGFVCGDLCAAIGCDLFVLYLSPVTGITIGAISEFGARLGSGKETHVILNGMPDHLFFDHPCCKTHVDWDSFLAWLTEELDTQRRGTTLGLVEKGSTLGRVEKSS